MKKSRITDFQEKISATKKALERKLKDHYAPEKLTTADKVAQLMSGRARFKLERFEGDACPYGTPTLLEFYEFEGEEDMDARNTARDLFVKKTMDAVSKALEDIEMNFVLEKDGFDANQAIWDLVELHIPKKEVEDA